MGVGGQSVITPSFSLTATERVLPKLALDFTTASLDARVTFSRALATATRTNSNGNIVSVAADTPRFDYDPLTLVCKGLLIEESRQNLFKYSQDFSNAIWSKSQATIASTTVLSPDGVNYCQKFKENSGTVSPLLYQSSVSTYTGQFASWIVVKPAERTVISAGCNNLATTGKCVFDLVAKTVTTTTGANVSSGFIEEIHDGWFICGLITPTGRTGLWPMFAIGDGNTYTGDGSSGVYVWAAQFEAGAFRTSYIPNADATLNTRNADVATMTGTNFSDWYNQTEGTFVVQAISQSGAGRYFFTCGQMYAYMGTPSGVRFETNSAPARTASVNSVFERSPVKFSAAHLPDHSLRLSVNGGAVASTATGAQPTATSLSLGVPYFSTTTQLLCGHIQKFAFYQNALTNAELQAFSK